MTLSRERRKKNLRVLEKERNRLRNRRKRGIIDHASGKVSRARR